MTETLAVGNVHGTDHIQMYASISFDFKAEKWIEIHVLKSTISTYVTMPTRAELKSRVFWL